MEDKTMQIFVIDDEPDVVNALVSFFTRKGYKAQGAHSAEEALEALESHAPNVIFLDLHLPGISGAEVAKIINWKYPATKIILVSGYPEESKKLSEDAVLAGVFTKPVEINDLYTKLQDILYKDKPANGEKHNVPEFIARMLVIKAKLLFLESSAEISKAISMLFQGFSGRSTHCELKFARTVEEAKAELSAFKPDMLVVNTQEFPLVVAPGKAEDDDLVANSAVIVEYNLPEAIVPNEELLKKLEQNIQLECFRHGFVDVSMHKI